MSDRRLVFPVGQHGGGFRDGAGAWRFTVRRGADVVTLSGPQHLMWLAAHGSSAQVAETTWTRDAVLALGGEFGLSDPATTFRELVDVGLVTEVEPDGPAAVGFARGHQVVPLTYGLGNTAEEPDWYGLGFPPRPWVSVPGPMWTLLAHGHLEPSLWGACRAAGQEDPHRLLAGVLGGLHPLLSVQAVYLDRGRAAA